MSSVDPDRVPNTSLLFVHVTDPIAKCYVFHSTVSGGVPFDGADVAIPNHVMNASSGVLFVGADVRMQNYDTLKSNIVSIIYSSVLRRTACWCRLCDARSCYI